MATSSTPRHTRAPWRAAAAGTTWFVHTADFDIVACDIDNQADAHVMAAAPELLQELRRADTVIDLMAAHLTDEQHGELDCDLTRRGYRNHRAGRLAAVYKAEGRS